MKRVGALAAIAIGLAASVAVATRRSGVRSGAGHHVRFDPDEVARLETAGWRAYYERDFGRGLLLLLRLSRRQLGLGPLSALRASHAAVRAQMAFAPKRNDPEAALRWLARFYSLSPRREGVESAELAQAELDYWVVHRRIVDVADKTPLVDAFARLHALIFGGGVAAMRPSAEQRTLACNAVDRITGKTTRDPAGDWALVERHLAEGYRLAVAVAKES